MEQGTRITHETSIIHTRKSRGSDAMEVGRGIIEYE
jgi:hypothetical protein